MVALQLDEDDSVLENVLRFLNYSLYAFGTMTIGVIVGVIANRKAKVHLIRAVILTNQVNGFAYKPEIQWKFGLNRHGIGISAQF